MIECRDIVNQVKREAATAKPTLSSESPTFPAPETSSCLECQRLQDQFKENPGGKPMSNKGLVLAALTGGAALSLSVICLPFVTPALRKYCLPYVPATNQQVENVLKALSLGGTSKSNPVGKQKLVDVGSGDGRIVLACAKAGYQAHGIELNLWLVLYSRWRAFFSKDLKGKATFAKQDLWKSNFSPYQKVVIFGVEEMMPHLESKLSDELNSEGEVVACRFPFPNWVPYRTVGEGIDCVWLYRPNLQVNK